MVIYIIILVLINAELVHKKEQMLFIDIIYKNTFYF